MSRKKKLPDNVVQFNSRIRLLPTPVTQKELFEEEFHQEEAALWVEDWKKARLAIQKKLDAGARIEPGVRMGMTTDPIFLKYLGIK